MRTSVLFPLFALLASGVAAQPILDQTAVGQVGSTYYMGIQDTFGPGFNLGGAGSNQTWDFSSLWVNDTDTVWFIDPDSSNYGAQFPTANLVIKQASLGDGEAFLQSAPGYLDLLGLAADLLNTGSPIVVHQNPPSRIAQFPFTYLDSYSGVAVIDVTEDASSLGIPFVDSARYKNVLNRNAVADGYGTLTLPAGTYTNALRVKEINHQVDSIWIHTFLGWSLYQDSSYTDSTFTWWNGSKGYFLAQAVYEGPNLGSIEYQDPVIVGKPDVGARLFAVYPNPALNRLSIDTDGRTYELRIHDLQGRLVAQEEVVGTHAELEVGGFQRGYYLYSVLDQRGTVLQSGKLVLGYE